jgi:hypothetical protein
MQVAFDRLMEDGLTAAQALVLFQKGLTDYLNQQSSPAWMFAVAPGRRVGRVGVTGVYDVRDKNGVYAGSAAYVAQVDPAEWRAFDLVWVGSWSRSLARRHGLEPKIRDQLTRLLGAYFDQAPRPEDSPGRQLHGLR